MSKLAKEKTVLELKKLPVGTHAIGGVKGLYLRKRTKESGYYLLRYSDATGRHDYVIGSYADVSLANARLKAHEAREKLSNGVSPIEERAAARMQAIEEFQKAKAKAKIIRFEQLATEWVETREKEGFLVNNLDGAKDTLSILKRHVFPYLGSFNIENITPEDVKKCLEPIWQKHPSTARKAKSYISKSLQWAIAIRKRQNRENPAAMQGALGVLMESLQKNKKEKQNHAACAVNEIPHLFQEIQQYDSMSARAVEFAILTAARSQAVRMATWEEFDLKKGIWNIPVEHDKMKGAKRDRTIFLSPQAVQLLKHISRFSDSPYVFPSRQGGYFSDTSLNMFLKGVHDKRKALDNIGWIDPVKSKQTGIPAVITIHGTARASFRTWAKDDELGNNKKFDQEAVELCLLHAKNDDYDGAYDRAKFPKERQKIMAAWGQYCYSKSHNGI